MKPAEHSYLLTGMTVSSLCVQIDYRVFFPARFSILLIVYMAERKAERQR